MFEFTFYPVHSMVCKDCLVLPNSFINYFTIETRRYIVKFIAVYSLNRQIIYSFGKYRNSKGTVSVIFSNPPSKDSINPINNSTLFLKLCRKFHLFFYFKQNSELSSKIILRNSVFKHERCAMLLRGWVLDLIIGSTFCSDNGLIHFHSLLCISAIRFLSMQNYSHYQLSSLHAKYYTNFAHV